MTELSSTIVLYYGPWATMTVEVFQRIGSGDLGPASADATILIVSVLIPPFHPQPGLGQGPGVVPVKLGMKNYSITVNRCKAV